MAAARACMRQVREVFRLHLLEKKSQAFIAKSLDLGKTTVGDYIRRLIKNSLQDWSVIESLGDAELESRLGFSNAAIYSKCKVMPDWISIHAEMCKPHVTTMLLWSEYRERVGDAGYEYTQFREHYNRWTAKLSVVMRQMHRAGEKTFIDYSGDGLKLVDTKTGEISALELFIAVLGASSYTYAEVSRTQTSSDLMPFT